MNSTINCQQKNTEKCMRRRKIANVRWGSRCVREGERGTIGAINNKRERKKKRSANHLHLAFDSQRRRLIRHGVQTPSKRQSERRKVKQLIRNAGCHHSSVERICIQATAISAISQFERVHRRILCRLTKCNCVTLAKLARDCSERR